ncbi:helix-turn-helix domain-containing protein [Thermogemmatispora sp.]|uniref:WD40 domain-containing protein n=1 Tax=Thermogemmatispora sp. TaxID=1968838 RepID=UPI0035E4557E
MAENRQAPASAVAIGTRMRTLRQQKGKSLSELARAVGYSKSYLSAVENNVTLPSRQLLEGYERALQLRGGELVEVLLGEQLEQLPRGRRRAASTLAQSFPPIVSASAASLPRCDLEEAPYVSRLYGRDEEQELLWRWVMQERCRLIAIVGIGGVGKTALAAALVQRLRSSSPFRGLLWLSLHAPLSRRRLLDRCLRFILGEQAHQPGVLPESEEDRLKLLIQRLEEEPFLLVLDDFDSLLQSGALAGQYKEDYKGYEELLYLLGSHPLQSCVVLTSREKPNGIPLQEGKDAPVRTMTLAGVSPEAGRLLLAGEGLEGDDGHWAEFIRRYAGNPLALKLVSPTIREVFDRQIARFLEQEVLVLQGIRDLLDKQFERLTPDERDVLYWLAIGREVVTLSELLEDRLARTPKGALLEVLKSLRYRSLVEVRGAAGYTLQPVICEYVTERLVQHVAAELLQERPLSLLQSHALLKAQARDYIREDQGRAILEPLARILRTAKGQAGCEQLLRSLLARLERNKPGYAAGNLLNLLLHLQCDLRGWDFSGLAVWQANLRGKALPNVNFAWADLTGSAFTEIFGSILSVALSPDGSLLALGTTTCEIRIFRLRDYAPLVTCQGHADWVRSVLFSPDGRMVISGSEDGTIRLWDVETGQCLQTLHGHGERIYSIAVSADGGLLASGGGDQTVRLWRIEGTSGLTECVRVLSGPDLSGRIYAVAFTPDGRLISGGEDAIVRLWDVESGSCLARLDGHSRGIWSLALSRDGRLLACGGEEQIMLWDLTSLSLVASWKAHRDLVYALSFSSDGCLLASAGGDRLLRLWSVAERSCLKTLEGHSRRVYSLALSADDRTLVSGSDDQTVRFWDLDRGRCMRMLQGYSSQVRTVATSPDGQLFASGGDDGQVRLWDLTKLRCLRTLEGHTASVWTVTFDRQGRLLASSSEDGTVRLWQVETGQCFRILRGHAARVYMVAFSPDGSLLASGGADRTLRIWEVATGQCLHVLREHRGRVYAVAYSPDGRLLVSGAEDQTICLWDTRDYRCLRKLSAHIGAIYTLTISPDGRWLITAGADQMLRLWDLAQLEEGLPRALLAGHRQPVWTLAVSPDSRLLASGGNDQLVCLWDLESGELLKILNRFDYRIREIAFSRGEQPVLLVAGGHTGTIEVWDVERALRVRVLRGDRPYEGMNIYAATGLSLSQRSILRSLGAVENPVEKPTLAEGGDKR